MVKNIVFDLGGVLIDWNPRYVFRQVFGTEEEVNNFLENICTMEWNVQQDAGRSLSEATASLTQKHPEWAEHISQYYGRWEEMLGEAIKGSVDILKKFIDDDNYQVYALTNWSAETFPVALARFEFLSWFEGIVVSGDEKCIKPDHKIYYTLFDRYELKAEECLFIDDNADNVIGSIEAGMPAIKFENPEQLQKELDVYLAMS